MRTNDHECDPLSRIDITLVNQLAQAMQHQQDLEPDPARDQAIRHLHAIQLLAWLDRRGAALDTATSPISTPG